MKMYSIKKHSKKKGLKGWHNHVNYNFSRSFEFVRNTEILRFEIVSRVLL